MVQTLTVLRMCAVYDTSHRFSLWLSPQLLQQRLGVLQVGRIKALGEPAVDRCQQLTGCGALALLLPQPAQAHGGSQPPEPGLPADHDEGLLIAGRCLPTPLVLDKSVVYPSRYYHSLGSARERYRLQTHRDR